MSYMRRYIGNGTINNLILERPDGTTEGILRLVAFLNYELYEYKHFDSFDCNSIDDKIWNELNSL